MRFLHKSEVDPMQLWNVAFENPQYFGSGASGALRHLGFACSRSFSALTGTGQYSTGGAAFGSPLLDPSGFGTSRYIGAVYNNYGAGPLSALHSFLLTFACAGQLLSSFSEPPPAPSSAPTFTTYPNINDPSTTTPPNAEAGPSSGANGPTLIGHF